MTDSNEKQASSQPQPAAKPEPTPEIKVWRLTKISDRRAVSGFIDVYREAFAGPPYFEKMTRKHVLNEVLKPHLKYGLVLIAEVDGQIAGLACGYPMLAPIHVEIRDFLLAQPKDQVPFNPHFAFFESELAALASVRKMGMGNHLLKLMHKWAWDNRYTVYVGRTAEIGSNAIRLHQRNGAVQLPFVQDAGEEEKKVQSQASRKVWFYGQTEPFATYGS
ncbi:MAG TPA: GNAT family N-acetyltransferase [Candidatus Obscuribacterales bacterium]